MVFLYGRRRKTAKIWKIIEKHVEIYNNMENGELLDGTGDLYYNDKIKRK